MKNCIILGLLLLIATDLAFSQQISEIPLPTMGKERKAAMNAAGELFIVGRNLDGFPEITKLDTNGQVIWQKYFNDSAIIIDGSFKREARFDNIVFDVYENMYLLTELEKNPRKPFVVKLSPEGELIWVSEELNGVGNAYEYAFDSWMFVGDSTLTVVTGYSISMHVDLATGEYLGIDPVLSNHYMNRSAPEMVYNGQHYRKTMNGFLVFDSTGNYSFQPDDEYIPFDVWHVDSFGYYADSSYSSSLLNENSEGKIAQINKINFQGGIEQSVLCATDNNYQANAEKNIIT